MGSSNILLAAHHGRRTPGDQASFVWELLSSHGHRLTKDGKALDTLEQNLDELLNLATEFVDKRLPILKGLGVGLA